MDTLDFLRTLLPEEGVKFVAQWVAVDTHPRKGFFKHKPFVEFDDMADYIKQQAAQGKTVYHACSSFEEVQYITTKAGKEVPAGRTKDNARAARALWMDFDVGKDAAHSYDSKKDVITALAGFLKALSLPVPMVVDSGNGIHAYFLLSAALPRSKWEPLALKLRAVCDHYGLKYDPSRTSDIASVLRPAGSSNFKNPDCPKPVTVKREGVAVSAETLHALFDAYIDSHDLTVQLSIPTTDFGGLNSDLITPVEYPDSSAAVIVNFCQQVRSFSETGGIDEPTWYTNLGLLKHCTDGQELIHKWSAKYAGYDEAETQLKLDQWSYGPSTCDKFRSVNAKGCDGCTHKCKSPIQLGYTMPENVEHTPIEVADDDTPQEELAVGPGSEFWPEGYVVRNGRIDVARENEDGTIGYVPLVAPPFWVISEVRSETGEFMLHCRAEIKKDKHHDFDIPTSCVSSADKLKSALAANRIYALNASSKGGYELMNLVAQTSLAMQRKRDEINTHSQMGWNTDKTAFLLGDTLIHKDGSTKVRVGQSITNVNKGEHSLIDAMETSGTVQEYHDGVMHLYGHPGFEATQYVLATALGAYLAPFVQNDEWHGIPLSVYSSRSGYGKTTCAAIGLNAMCKNIKSRSSDGTLRAFKKMLSIYGSLPVFYDELTDKINPSEQKDLLYNWSLGMERMGLNQNGTMRERGEVWCNMGITSTNKSVLFQLTEDSTDPEATQVRVMEIDLADYLPHKPRKEDQKLATHLATNVYGVVTERFIRAVLKNRDKIEQAILDEFHTITSSLPEDVATTSRFLCYHAACTLTGAKLGRSLGLWDFSVADIRKFITRHISSQLEKIREYRVSPEDRFAAMMADFNGKILVTTRFDTLDARSKRVEESLVRCGNTIVGRYAIGCHATKSEIGDPGRLYVTVSAINDWCHQRDLNPSEVRREWKSAGLLELDRGAGPNGEKSVRLNTGMPSVVVGRARCLEFVVSKVHGVIPESLVPRADVVPLNQVKGEAARVA